MYGLSVVTPPDDFPLTMSEAKVQSRVRLASTSEDDLIFGLIAAATEMSEAHCTRAWLTRTLLLTVNDFPDSWRDRWGGAIALPVQPVTAVNSVKYYDTYGVLQTLDPARWQTWLDHSPPLVATAPRTVWPTSQQGRMQPVQVEFVAGYGEAGAVPVQVKTAMKMLVTYWYENRGDGRDPNVMSRVMGIPPAVCHLLDSVSPGSYG